MIFLFCFCPLQMCFQVVNPVDAQAVEQIVGLHQTTSSRFVAQANHVLVAAGVQAEACAVAAGRPGWGLCWFYRFRSHKPAPVLNILTEVVCMAQPYTWLRAGSRHSN